MFGKVISSDHGLLNEQAACYRAELTARLQNEKTALQTELEVRRWSATSTSTRRGRFCWKF